MPFQALPGSPWQVSFSSPFFVPDEDFFVTELEELLPFEELELSAKSSLSSIGVVELFRINFPKALDNFFFSYVLLGGYFMDTARRHTK